MYEDFFELAFTATVGRITRLFGGGLAWEMQKIHHAFIRYNSHPRSSTAFLVIYLYPTFVISRQGRVRFLFTLLDFV